jgi:hypothetical protein
MVHRRDRVAGAAALVAACLFSSGSQAGPLLDSLRGHSIQYSVVYEVQFPKKDGGIQHNVNARENTVYIGEDRRIFARNDHQTTRNNRRTKETVFREDEMRTNSKLNLTTRWVE